MFSAWKNRSTGKGCQLFIRFFKKCYLNLYLTEIFMHFLSVLDDESDKKNNVKKQ